MDDKEFTIEWYANKYEKALDDIKQLRATNNFLLDVIAQLLKEQSMCEKKEEIQRLWEEIDFLKYFIEREGFKVELKVVK